MRVHAWSHAGGVSSALIDLGVACSPRGLHATPISTGRAPDPRLATGHTRGALCLVSAAQGSCSCCVPAQVGSGTTAAYLPRTPSTLIPVDWYRRLVH